MIVLELYGISPGELNCGLIYYHTSAQTRHQWSKRPKGILQTSVAMLGGAPRDPGRSPLVAERFLMYRVQTAAM